MTISEKDFMGQVIDLARMTGWRVYHTYDSRRSEAGFPDLVLVHPRRERVIFAELKSATGQLSVPQKAWLAALDEAGADVRVWRPDDLDLVTAILTDRPYNYPNQGALFAADEADDD